MFQRLLFHRWWQRRPAGTGRNGNGGGGKKQAEEGPYSFTEIMWEKKFLFLCIPPIMMFFRGLQETNWPTVEARVIETQDNGYTIRYRYYIGVDTIEHAQTRKSWHANVADKYHSDEAPCSELVPGDTIRVHCNPQRPHCSVFRPIPIAVWHLGITCDRHPHLGTILNKQDSSRVIEES
jgi:hypothetical protein